MNNETVSVRIEEHPEYGIDKTRGLFTYVYFPGDGYRYARVP